MSEQLGLKSASHTISDARRALEAGSLTPVELAERSANALLQADPLLGIVSAIEEDRWRPQAEAATARFREGATTGALDGIPMAHKEMFYRPGRVSRCGGVLFDHQMQTELATVLKRLDDAGAVDLGQLAMVEVAMGVTGHNQTRGTPKNPWDPSRITGGSSSGSAAAVATGAVFSALGSDTGGSIRLPAACCGIVGIKPSHHLAPRTGALPLAPSLDTFGPLTRSVADAALMLSCLVGSDGVDPAADGPGQDFVGSLEGGAEGGRFALADQSFMESVDAPILAALETVASIAEKSAMRRSEVDMARLSLANDLASEMISCEGFRAHEQVLATTPTPLGEQTAARLRRGRETSDERHEELRRMRRSFDDYLLEGAFAKADVVAFPMLPGRVPTIAESDVAANPGFMEYLQGFARFARPFNFVGLPALVLPVTLDDAGLPIAVQLVAKWHDDARLLAVAHKLERELAFSNRPRVWCGEGLLP
ncbi:MAG: amidase [Geminicoccaceae bacterium]